MDQRAGKLSRPGRQAHHAALPLDGRRQVRGAEREKWDLYASSDNNGVSSAEFREAGSRLQELDITYATTAKRC